MRTMLIALAALVFAPPAMAADTWRTFRDSDGVFSFETPGEVRTERRQTALPDGSPVQVTIYGYGIDAPVKPGCGASKIELEGGRPINENTPVTMAENFKKQISMAGIKTDTDIQVTLDNHTGWHLAFMDKKENLVDFRWFVASHRLFQFICLTPPNTPPAEISEVTRVSNSFHFLVN